MVVALDSPEVGSTPWIELFHQGERRLLTQLYSEHFDTVAQAVGSILSGADRENIIHDVFVSLIESRSLRENFTGGSISAWLRRIARNRAIDLYRRNRRGTQISQEIAQQEEEPVSGPDAQAEAMLVNKLMHRFKSECIPEKWHPVFEACFVKRLSQRDAAKVLGMRRTTLAYQETRIRAALKTFILNTDAGIVDA